VDYFFDISVSYENESGASWFTKKQFWIEFVDVVEQFAKRARGVVEKSLALFRGSFGGVTDRAALVQILRLPGEGDGPMRRQPPKFFLHVDTGGSKVGDRFLAHALRIARQHDRGLGRTTMNAMPHLLFGEQPIRYAEAKPARGDDEHLMMRAQILPHQRHRRAVSAVARHDHQLPDPGSRGAFADRHPLLQRDVGRQ